MINTMFISFSQSLKIYRSNSETLMFHELQVQHVKEHESGRREINFKEFEEDKDCGFRTR